MVNATYPTLAVPFRDFYDARFVECVRTWSLVEETLPCYQSLAQSAGVNLNVIDVPMFGTGDYL